MKECKGKELGMSKDQELEAEEVNVYSLGCGTIKVHCMYDCFTTNDAWISTDQ